MIPKRDPQRAKDTDIIVLSTVGLKRKSTQIPRTPMPVLRSAPIVDGALLVGNNAYHLHAIGAGNDHNVYEFNETAIITIPTDHGSIMLNSSEIVIKAAKCTEQAAGKYAQNFRNKEIKAYEYLPERFAYFGITPPPVAQRLVKAEDWRDTLRPQAGIDIWQRCDAIDNENPLMLSRFWNFGQEMCHLAIKFARNPIKKGEKEFIGDFRPQNVMLNPGTEDKFVIIDSLPPENDDWKMNLRSYIEDWCKKCNKSWEEMTANWSPEERAALPQLGKAPIL